MAFGTTEVRQLQNNAVLAAVRGLFSFAQGIPTLGLMPVSSEVPLMRPCWFAADSSLTSPT